MWCSSARTFWRNLFVCMENGLNVLLSQIFGPKAYIFLLRLFQKKNSSCCFCCGRPQAFEIVWDFNHVKIVNLKGHQWHHGATGRRTLDCHCSTWVHQDLLSSSFLFTGSRLHREPLDLYLLDPFNPTPPDPVFGIKKGFTRLLCQN